MLFEASIYYDPFLSCCFFSSSCWTPSGRFRLSCVLFASLLLQESLSAYRLFVMDMGGSRVFSSDDVVEWELVNSKLVFDGCECEIWDKLRWVHQQHRLRPSQFSGWRIGGGRWAVWTGRKPFTTGRGCETWNLWVELSRQHFFYWFVVWVSL